MEYPHLYQVKANKPLFITKSGLDSLRKKLERLMRERFNAVKQMRATDQEDKDSIVLADEIRRIEAMEAEVIHINDLLAKATPITEPKKSTEVQIGSTVTLQGDTGRIAYTIVCPLEVDLDLHKISEESPLGKALLGKKLHETISVPTRSGEMLQYEVIAIQ
jgi:transcription elongation factor GreA